MADPISIVIAGLALGVSIYTLWVTSLQKGRLAMTKPTIVFFGHDTAPRTVPKVFIRALLYSTGVKGHVIETMYATLAWDGVTQTFGFWGYAETTEISPGSGLYVSQTGVAANHHFVLSVHQADYVFTAGRYSVRVYARLVGKDTPACLADFALTVAEAQAGEIAKGRGVLFELSPEDAEYRGYARSPSLVLPFGAEGVVFPSED